MYFKIAPFRAGELILMKLLLADFADKADFKTQYCHSGGISTVWFFTEIQTW
jgi:hypothetical protein